MLLTEADEELSRVELYGVILRDLGERRPEWNEEIFSRCLKTSSGESDLSRVSEDLSRVVWYCVVLRGCEANVSFKAAIPATGSS